MSGQPSRGGTSDGTSDGVGSGGGGGGCGGDDVTLPPGASARDAAELLASRRGALLITGSDKASRDTRLGNAI